jgi:hypothetical protein
MMLAMLYAQHALCPSCVIFIMRYPACRSARHVFISFLVRVRCLRFVGECFSRLQFRDGLSGIADLKALAIQNGFCLSARESHKAVRIRLYCHRTFRCEKHRRTGKTGCPMKHQLLREDGL